MIDNTNPLTKPLGSDPRTWSPTKPKDIKILGSDPRTWSPHMKPFICDESPKELKEDVENIGGDPRTWPLGSDPRTWSPTKPIICLPTKPIICGLPRSTLITKIMDETFEPKS